MYLRKCAVLMHLLLMMYIMPCCEWPSHWTHNDNSALPCILCIFMAIFLCRNFSHKTLEASSLSIPHTRHVPCLGIGLFSILERETKKKIYIYYIYFYGSFIINIPNLEGSNKLTGLDSKC